jgi:hypothetical protein
LPAVFFAGFLDRDLLRQRWISVAVAAAIVLLAIVETVNAVVAPRLAPTDKDWQAAAAKVRAGFRAGDLIVAAPVWADPILRLHLGDLLPVPVAGRMDAARYGRIWEISQRGARSADTAGATASSTAEQGALTVRLWQKAAANVRFDAVSQWRQGNMAVITPDQGEIPCGQTADRFQCASGPVLRPELVEVDTTLKNALALDPIERGVLVLEFADVPLGRELAVATGLHNVWLRKSGSGKVAMRVLVDGRLLGTVEASSASGWSVKRFDISAVAGRSGKIRFEITTDNATSRHFAFAAEARDR